MVHWVFNGNLILSSDKFGSALFSMISVQFVFYPVAEYFFFIICFIWTSLWRAAIRLLATPSSLLKDSHVSQFVFQYILFIITVWLVHFLHNWVYIAPRWRHTSEYFMGLEHFPIFWMSTVYISISCLISVEIQYLFLFGFTIRFGEFLLSLPPLILKLLPYLLGSFLINPGYFRECFTIILDEGGFLSICMFDFFIYSRSQLVLFFPRIMSFWPYVSFRSLTRSRSCTWISSVKSLMAGIFIISSPSFSVQHLCNYLRRFITSVCTHSPARFASIGVNILGACFIVWLRIRFIRLLFLQGSSLRHCFHFTIF